MEPIQQTYPAPALGYTVLEGWSLLKMTGKDRLSFLSGITTNSVKTLQAGQGNRSLLLTVKGRIVSEILAVNLGDALGLWIPTTQFEKVRQTLDRYLILEDVVLTPVPEAASPLLLAGKEVEDWLQKRALDLPEMGDSVALKEGVTVVRLPLWGELPVLFFASTEEDTSLAWLQEQEVSVLSDEVVQAGALVGEWLDSGLELEDILVHEAELENTHVDFKKGCFLGQEVVARTHYRGRARKSIATFVLPSALSQESAARFVVGEKKEVGHVQTRYQIGETFVVRGLLKDSALEKEEDVFVLCEDSTDRIPTSFVEWNWT